MRHEWIWSIEKKDPMWRLARETEVNRIMIVYIWISHAYRDNLNEFAISIDVTRDNYRWDSSVVIYGSSLFVKVKFEERERVPSESFDLQVFL